jgi:hypothetical protein
MKYFEKTAQSFTVQYSKVQYSTVQYSAFFTFISGGALELKWEVTSGLSESTVRSDRDCVRYVRSTDD